MKILLKNVEIFDGSAEKSFYGNILIEDDKIKNIGNSADAADEIIDCSGLAASPGFIDTHSHSDLNVLLKPELLPKIMQGITTEVLGQDGVSMAPLPEKYITPWRKNLAGLDGDSDLIDWHYQTTEKYLKMIEAVKPAINECYLVPHGNVRMEVIGLSDNTPDSNQLEQMKQVLRRELDAGAYGLSTGLIYMPCAYSVTAELIALCKVVAEYDGVFVVHQRSEADTILESMEEVLRIGRESGVRIHYSHFKICGKKNWQYIQAVVELLDKAAAEGIRVSFDQYPYVAGSTMLSVILPSWVHDGGTDQVMERLQSPSLRQKMIKDIECGIPGWDNFIDFAGFENIYVTSVKTQKNQDAIGLSLLELAGLRQKDPYQAAFDLLLEEENAVGMVDFYGTEDHVKLFMKRPEMNVCTDGLLGGKPHPRVYGAFPRVLGKYVREEKIFPLEEGIYKMTKKAATALGIKNRGELKTGFFADIVVFDAKKILDQGNFIDPVQYPIGIEYVFVNGKKMVEQGNYDNKQERFGRVLYKS